MTDQEVNQLLEPITGQLLLPFTEQDYQVSAGWLYDQPEQSIHGFTGHGGVDFALPVGTPIYAPHSGWAIASYFNRPILENGQPRLYQGKYLRIGYGWFVQIWHPDWQVWTNYSHLDQIADGLKIHQPRVVAITKISDAAARLVDRSDKTYWSNYWPVGHKLSGDRLESYPFVTKVKAGQLLGYVGDSGIGWGYVDYPTRPDSIFNPSWDPPHLHFELFIRYGSRLAKKGFDPYGLKSSAKDYPDPHRRGAKLGDKSPLLWKLGPNGLPQFIK